ncbi:aminodeoxychorismate synthase component I [Petrocella sp. FN5]|uniref:aminodeoxychorismate synthase component I n=1 Tax=Petrocella sp. FN5 TaxID=3032002 RepID=UPI0023DB567E|nr:aminodeoxychorismate synthase component I [Petrocella sp. FN5]MDF1617083.1 aminodeoxychorismate synthase component I [Petrocella sp. FN5]
MRVQVNEITTELSSFDIFSLFKDEEDIIFLDSSKDSEKLGKYSFIGLNPYKKITYDQKIITLDNQKVDGDPFEVLKELLGANQIQNTFDLPFVAGCMGYFAYDLVRDIEKLPNIAKPIMEMPAMVFVFYHHLLIFDHHCHKTYLSVFNPNQKSDQKTTLELEKKTTRIMEIIKSGHPVIYRDTVEEEVTFTSCFDEATYIKAVEKMKEYILNGDIYIANMTHTYTAMTNHNAYDIYKSLRKVNQAPFSAFMSLDETEILCSSPERFMQIRDNKVETRPIKGTRPRGMTEDEDEAYRLELEKSEKDKSELLMVVDLERNDLSKVCRPYTVKVTELFGIESYATVHHLVATIVGKLKQDMTAVDCIKACFPGGSITGTPKIRAMEIIEELEPTRRHLYTGCIGYFGFDGSADFNIVIRTIIKQKEWMAIGVGGGITWESDPKAEYEETLDKAKALFKAVRLKEIDI